MNLLEVARNGVCRFASLLLLASTLSVQGRGPAAEVYTKALEIHGISILGTEGVDEEYLYIAALVYDHMTSRREPIDIRAAHRASGFRILMIPPEARFLDLPEFAGGEEELEEADGLGGCIGEFFIALRVGSPHTLVHEMGHGIYHSAIQYMETGGADDEEAWYSERVRAVHGLDMEAAVETYGEEVIHEVLLAPEGTFSADLAEAWYNAFESGIWRNQYGGTEPNEYWAEGVALWFRAAQPTDEDPRAYLKRMDPMLYELCARIFPDEDWDPGRAAVASESSVHFENEDEGPASDREDGADRRDKPNRIGDCILRQATGVVPTDPYAVSDITLERHHPLPKRLNACGIALVASSEVPDLFLQLVGETVSQIFQPKDALDTKAQREVLEHLHRYRACLPVPSTEPQFERLFQRDPEAMDRVMDENSTCDIIMAAVPEGQVMEVVEHLLHAISDVGLHYRFPKEWGISRESELWRAMQRAIDAGYYEIESYRDIEEDAPRDVYHRVLLQEFAYWFISTAWDLQEDYGPNEDEWTIRTSAELREKMPEFWAVYERTAGAVMSAPSRETLAEIGPTRRRERD